MSKFAGVIAARRDAEEIPLQDQAHSQESTEEGQESAPEPQKAAKSGRKRQKAVPTATKNALAPKEARKPGRPPAKRSDPDFVQTTAYILGKTHREVKIALLNEGQGREYSELVEELLAKWLKSQTSNGLKV